MSTRKAVIAWLVGLLVPLLLSTMMVPARVGSSVFTNPFQGSPGTYFTLSTGTNPIASGYTFNPATDAVILLLGQSNMGQYGNFHYTPTQSAHMFEFLYGDGTLRQWVEPIFGPPGVQATHTGDIHGNTILDNLGSTSDILVGAYVAGFGLLTNTNVTAINSSTSVTLNQAATVTTTGGTYTFNTTERSWFSMLGDKLINAGKFNNIVFVPTGIGGTRASQWGPFGDDGNGWVSYHSVITGAIQRLRGAGLPITMILVGQGETETFYGFSGDVWAGHWKANVQVSRNLGVNAKWFFAQETLNAGVTSASVHAAQAAIADANLRIFAGPELDQFSTSLHRYDATHLTFNGANAVSTVWSTVIQAQSFP